MRVYDLLLEMANKIAKINNFLSNMFGTDYTEYTSGTVGMDAILNKMYPIGTIYQTDKTEAEFDPNTEFTGTWELIKDGFIYCADEDVEAYKVNTTGGHAGPWYHTHTISIGDSGTHYHGSYDKYGNTGAFLIGPQGTTLGECKVKSGSTTTYPYLHVNAGGADCTSCLTTQNAGNHSHTITLSTDGDLTNTNVANANIPPYIAITTWKRVS